MFERRFYCHDDWQDFEEYQHKTLDRTYYFGRCSKCGKHFFIKDDEIIEGRKAKDEFKYLRRNLIKVEYSPALIYLKSLCFAVPAKETTNIYATDENGKIIIREVFKKKKNGNLVLDKNKNPILLERRKILEKRIVKEFQNIQIETKGIIQNVTTSIELGIEPNVFEEKILQSA